MWTTQYINNIFTGSLFHGENRSEEGQGGGDWEYVEERESERER